MREMFKKYKVLIIAVTIFVFLTLVGAVIYLVFSLEQEISTFKESQQVGIEKANTVVPTTSNTTASNVATTDESSETSVIPSTPTPNQTQAQKSAPPKPETKPAPVAPSCNQSEKTAQTNQYNQALATATNKRDVAETTARNKYALDIAAIDQEYQDIENPIVRDQLRAQARAMASTTLQQSLNIAETEYSGVALGLNALYQANLDSIHC